MPSFFVWFLRFLGARGKPSQRKRLRFLLPLLDFRGMDRKGMWLRKQIVKIAGFSCCQDILLLAVKTCEFGHKERLEQKSGNVRALF